MKLLVKIFQNKIRIVEWNIGSAHRDAPPEAFFLKDLGSYLLQEGASQMCVHENNKQTNKYEKKKKVLVR